MNAYTVSQLAKDAGVSVHIVRDYLVRGLLHPAARTDGGYGVFDANALHRLCFVRAAVEAGVGLDVLTRLCRSLDASNADKAVMCLAEVGGIVDERRQALVGLEAQLSALRAEVGRREEARR